MKPVKKVLAVVLALAMVLSMCTVAFAEDSTTTETPTHGTIGIVNDQNADSTEINLSVGETATISVQPYLHVQYAGCGMDECPEVCGGIGECFEVGTGCKCDTTPILRTTDVNTTVSGDSVSVSEATADDATFAASSSTVGDMSNGKIQITAEKAGTATVTVSGSLNMWTTSETTFTVNVAESTSADDTVLSAGSVITKGGDYTLATDAENGTITVNTTESVKITADGTSRDNLKIEGGVEGISLTIENLKINCAVTTGSSVSAIAVKGAGNKVTVNGTNILQQCVNTSENEAVINVPEGAELELLGTGTLYIKHHGYQAAAIGGNAELASGSITFNGPDVAILLENSSSAAIGSATASGAITFEAGNVTVHANGAPAVSAGSDNATVNGGNLAFDTENNAVAAIGAFNTGKFIANGGSIIISDNGSSASLITDADGNALYPVAIEAGGNDVSVDGAVVYTGTGNVLSYKAGDTVDTSFVKSETAGTVNLYLAGSTHTVAYGDTTKYAVFDSTAKTFTLTDVNPSDTLQSAITSGEAVLSDGKNYKSTAALQTAITAGKALIGTEATLDEQVAAAAAITTAISALEEGLPESSHPYGNSANETYNYNYGDGATNGVIVKFSDDTATESGYDFITITDADGNEIGRYSGTALAGKSIYVPTASFVIKLTSDTSGTENGFTVSSVTAAPDVIGISEYGALGTITPVAIDGTPDITVTVSGKTLVSGTDYEATYDTSAAGIKTATIKGIGSYTGTLTADFQVYDSEKVAKPTSLVLTNKEHDDADAELNQTIIATLTFDKDIKITDSDALANQLKYTIAGGDVASTARTISYAVDGNKLTVTFVSTGWVAVYGGVFKAVLGDAGYITGIEGTDGSTVLWPDEGFTDQIAMGIVVENAVSVGTSSVAAVTVANVAHKAVMRGMYFYQLVSIVDGTETVIYQGVSHAHNFYGSITRESIAETMATGINSNAEGYSAEYIDGTSMFQIKADEAKEGETIVAKMYESNAQVNYTSIFPESDHNYANNEDKTWEYSYENATAGLLVTFDAQTKTENGYDYIYVLDSNDNEIGKYTSTALAGATLYVPTSGVKIRLTSDYSGNYYGFKVASIVPAQAGNLATNGEIEHVSPIYLGETANIVVKAEGKTLTEGTDYTVSYDNATAGTNTVTVTGTGDYYYGTLTTTVLVSDPDHKAEGDALYSTNIQLRMASDTGTSYIRFNNLTEDYANNIESITLTPVDNDGNPETDHPYGTVTLTKDQLRVSGNYIYFNRTAENPVVYVEAGKYELPITRWGSTCVYNGQKYQVTIKASNYYKDVTGIETYYTGTSDKFSIIVDADGDSKTTDDQTVAASFSSEEIAEMATFANGSSQCGMTGFRTFSGMGVSLVDLLEKANVTVSDDDYFLLDTSDHYGNNFTYNDLFGTTRYFLSGIYDEDFYEQYKALVDSDDEAGSTIELRKLLAKKALEENSTVSPRINVSYVETVISGDDLKDIELPTESNTTYNSLVNYENQYRFFYGIKLVYDECNVTFDTDGGSEVAAQVVKGNYMTSTENTTMKSSYWANSLVIYRGAGEQYKEEESTAADSITVPENPTKEGYTFGGWYKDEACTDGNEYDFTEILDGDTTIYAKWIADPVEITVQPEDAVAGIGTTATMSVTATGEGLSYQWYYRTLDSTTWKKTSLSGNKTNTITMKAVESRQANSYRCVITDANGNKVTSYPATLTVIGTPLAITSQPASAEAILDNTTTMTVGATGDGLTYQWYYQAAGSSTWRKTSVSGNKTATITLKAEESRNGNSYRCVVTDKYGNKVTSDAATFTVTDKTVEITKQPISVTRNNGMSATMSVTATGEGLTYQWYYQAAGSSTWKKTSVSGNKTATIKMEATEARNGNSYRCVVTDANGSVVTSDAATLTVSK